MIDQHPFGVIAYKNRRVRPLHQPEGQRSCYAARPIIHFRPGCGVLPGAGRFFDCPPVAMINPFGWFGFRSLYSNAYLEPAAAYLWL